MQDTIIKGTGNSRTLKSVPNFLTLYPTYEAFAQALVAGELPVDLGGLNVAGVDQEGTALTKENLLSDATAKLYGLGADAAPDDALAKVKALLNTVDTNLGQCARMVSGSYTGTDAWGVNRPNTLTFPVAPKIVMIPGCTRISDKIHITYSGDSRTYWLCDMENASTSYTQAGTLGIYNASVGYPDLYGKKSSDGKVLYWYSASGSGYQMNDTRYRYYYYAFY